jgi:hypothetical protein
MAKGDTVYSLFGMKSPQEVAREQFQEAFSYTPGPSGYQRAGAGLGKLAGALFSRFGGPSEEVKRAETGQAILQSAEMDYARQQKMKEAEAKAAQQAIIDERLGGIEGAIATEVGEGRLPEVAMSEPTDNEKLFGQFNRNAGLYDMMAERLAAGGFTAEADKARNAATAQRLKALEAKKLIAETEAESNKTVKAPTTRTRIEGDKKIVEQWDGTKWTFVSEGDRYKPAGAVDPITEALGEQTVKKFGEYETQIESAQSSLNNLSTMEKLLDQDVITGTFANSRLAVEKALAQAGIIDGTRVANTEAFLAAAANQTIKLLETGALGSGTAVSDNDKKFMQEAAGGRIEITEDAIRRIIRINRQVAQEAFGTYNTFVKTAKTRFPEQGALFGGEKYYQGQRAKLEDGTIVVYDSKLGWVEQQ